MAPDHEARARHGCRKHTYLSRHPPVLFSFLHQQIKRCKNQPSSACARKPDGLPGRWAKLFHTRLVASRISQATLPWRFQCYEFELGLQGLPHTHTAPAPRLKPSGCFVRAYVPCACTSILASLPRRFGRPSIRSSFLRNFVRNACTTIPKRHLCNTRV